MEPRQRVLALQRRLAMESEVERPTDRMTKKHPRAFEIRTIDLEEREQLLRDVEISASAEARVRRDLPRAFGTRI